MTYYTIIVTKQLYSTPMWGIPSDFAAKTLTFHADSKPLHFQNRFMVVSYCTINALVWLFFNHCVTSYEKSMQQEEEGYQQQRRRLYSEVQEEKERIAQQASRQRAELDKLQRQLEDTHSNSSEAMRREYEKAREEQERRHQVSQGGKGRTAQTMKNRIRYNKRPRLPQYAPSLIFQAQSIK